jgi:hypothetical protein
LANLAFFSDSLHEILGPLPGFAWSRALVAVRRRASLRSREGSGLESSQKNRKLQKKLPGMMQKMALRK